MYSPKERRGTGRTGPIKAARRRRQLHPFHFHMGPVTLCITSVLLIGLMAVLYLSQQAQAVAANQELQNIHKRQEALKRQNQDLVDLLATEQSPAYIAEQAKKLGLVPVDPKDVQTIVIPRWQPTPEQDQDLPIKP
jgi:cell division protein FtsB